MSEWKRIDQILAHLNRQQARGNMTYKKAVDIEALISAFEHIRTVIIAENPKHDRPDPPLMSETALDLMLKGVGS